MLRRIFIALALTLPLSLPATAQEAGKTAAPAAVPDYATALKELRAIAEKGDPRVQNRLAIMYRRGDGVPRDDTEAVTWFRKAATQDYAVAQYNLAVMYRRGLGVAQDYTEAEAWFRKAAVQGNARAQYNLAVMYLKGDGVPPDHTEAEMWFRKAAAQGHAGAKKTLRLINEKRQELLQEKRQKQTQKQIKKAPPASAAGDFRVQLGSVKQAARALKEAERLNRVHGSVLGNLKIAPVRADLGERGIYYRLRAGPLDDRTAARELCRALSAVKQACLVVKP